MHVRKAGNNPLKNAKLKKIHAEIRYHQTAKFFWELHYICVANLVYNHHKTWNAINMSGLKNI